MNSAFAQDLVIETMKGWEHQLVTDAIFDVGYGNIGQTSNQTVICLEVDFGADGNATKLPE